MQPNISGPGPGPNQADGNHAAALQLGSIVCAQSRNFQGKDPDPVQRYRSDLFEQEQSGQRLVCPQ